MQFSDTSTKSGLIQRCEFYTGIGDTGISGSTYNLQLFTSLCNTNLNKIVTMILKAQGDWDYDDINHTDFPILTTSLVANQQDYSLPASENIVKIKRVEVTYDGTNWYKAEPIDNGALTTDSTQSTVNSEFSQSSPRYDIQYNSLFLYPVPTAASTNGLKLWVTRENDYFATTDTTQEAGIDEAFQPMIAIGASLEYALTKGLNNKNDLNFLWNEYESRLKDYYGNKQSERGLGFSSDNINYE